MICRPYIVLHSRRKLVDGGWSHESLNARLRPAQDERVDVAGAFIGVDRFQVHDVADDVEFIGDAVATVHVARHAGDIERGRAGNCV